MLEYDDERSGSFDPLSSVPHDKTLVLGMVTTKSGREETVDEVAGRIHEAASHFPIEQLGVSPQCGFASTVGGNPVTEDDERRKLELIVEVANQVWGSL